MRWRPFSRGLAQDPNRNTTSTHKIHTSKAVSTLTKWKLPSRPKTTTTKNGFPLSRRPCTWIKKSNSMPSSHHPCPWRVICLRFRISCPWGVPEVIAQHRRTNPMIPIFSLGLRDSPSPQQCTTTVLLQRASFHDAAQPSPSPSSNACTRRTTNNPLLSSLPRAVESNCPLRTTRLQNFKQQLFLRNAVDPT